MALLIELLHEHLKGAWPEHAVQIAQDGNGGIYAYLEGELVCDEKTNNWEGPDLAEKGQWSWYPRPRVNADDQTTQIITREMYEAYLVAIAIDWSDAPDDATHYGPDNGEYCEGFYQIRDGVAQYWAGEQHGYSETTRPITQLIPRTTQPVQMENVENDVSNW